MQIAYSLIEEQEGRKRLVDDYISFVGLLADPRYCGSNSFLVSISNYLWFLLCFTFWNIDHKCWLKSPRKPFYHPFSSFRWPD